MYNGSDVTTPINTSENERSSIEELNLFTVAVYSESLKPSSLYLSKYTKTHIITNVFYYKTPKTTIEN